MPENKQEIATEGDIGETDEELVVLTLDNSDYFAYIVKRYEIKLANYIRRITNVSEEEIEDILQDVFIKVYRNLNDFDQDLKFSSWIYRIAHNQVINNYRKIQARPQSNSINIDDKEAQDMTADIDIEKNIDAVLLKTRITGVLGRMDKKYREILILKFFEDKSYEEISDIVKKPMGTVASLINRAKAEFKKEYIKQQKNTPTADQAAKL